MNNSVAVDLLNRKERVSEEDIWNLIMESEEHFEADDEVVGATNEIESYAFNVEKRDESRKMTLVVREQR